MEQFLVLGQIPGTDLQITFLWTLYMLWAILTVVLLIIKYKSVRQQLFKLIDRNLFIKYANITAERAKYFLHKALAPRV